MNVRKQNNHKNEEKKKYYRLDGYQISTGFSVRAVLHPYSDLRYVVRLYMKK